MAQKKEEQYMKAAIAEIIKAFDKREIPVGTIVVCNEKIVQLIIGLTKE